MKIIVALVSTFALSQAALAQAPECRSVSDPGARLACYDKAAPPAPAAQQAATQKAGKSQAAAGKASKADSGQYVDSISAEDARMNSRLKTICRGC